MAGSLIRLLDRIFYQKVNQDWDSEIFRDIVLKYVNNQTLLLDVGAGNGIIPELNFKGIVKTVYGVDPDERVFKNPYLDQAYLGYGEKLDLFGEAQFDAVICCNVLEHIENPGAFFEEIGRILKRGGFLITKTPNKRHYVPFIARITPYAFHRFVNKLRGRKVEDTFPTFYRLNTKKAQLEAAKTAGLKMVEIKFDESRPEYLRFNFLAYLIGIGYERLVNTLNLKFLKVLLITIFVKE